MSGLGLSLVSLKTQRPQRQSHMSQVRWSCQLGYFHLIGQQKTEKELCWFFLKKQTALLRYNSRTLHPSVSVQFNDFCVRTEL